MPEDDGHDTQLHQGTEQNQPTMLCWRSPSHPVAESESSNCEQGDMIINTVAGRIQPQQHRQAQPWR